MINSIIDDLFSQFIKYVSEGRGIDEKKLKALIDSAPFTAQEALAHGLVNELGYETDLEKRIEEILSTKIRKISATGLLRVITLRDLLRLIDERIRGRAGIIALICDSGIITQGESRGSGGGPKTIGSQTLAKMLERLAADAGIKAIVLRLSSPGGSGIASDLVRNQIQAISQKKPVIVSMSDVAASGGYMIALGARKIVADPLTLTGSIGIISGKFNMENLLKKLGIYKEWVKRGKRALIYSSYKAFTKSEEQKLGSIMKSLYDDFVGKVAQVRDMDFKDAEQLARGRVWTGRQAKELGLVDELGGIKSAINLAKKEAGIPSHITPVIRLYSKPKYIRVSPIGKFFFFGERLDSLVDSLLTLKGEKILAMMPFWIDFK
jgi:protease-4